MNQDVIPIKKVLRFKDLHLVGKYFIFIFLVILFEGAIRKWVWGGATIALLGLRDMAVVFIVLWGIFYRKFDFHSWPEIFLFFWTGLIIFWTGLQLIAELQPPIVGFIGFRFWVLYLWLALLSVRTLSWSDIEYLLKFIGLTLLFMIPLALVQFISPPTAFINKQAGGAEEHIFQVVAGIVRTTGTFSFTAGYTTYLAFVTPSVLWLMGGGLKGSMHPMLRLLIIGLFFIGVLVSGSRGAIMSTLFFVFMWFTFLLLANRLPKISGTKIILGMIGFIILLVSLFPILEKSYEANTARFERASNVEDTNSRILNTFLGSDYIWENFDFLGKGIGGGANASKKFKKHHKGGTLLGEWEIDRVINEAGIVGILLMLLKWLSVLTGLWISWRIFNTYGEFLPLSIWIVLLIQLPTGQVIGQLSIHGFTLLLLAIGFVVLTSWRNEKLARFN